MNDGDETRTLLNTFIVNYQHQIKGKSVPTWGGGGGGEVKDYTSNCSCVQY